MYNKIIGLLSIDPKVPKPVLPEVLDPGENQ
jgi:hypothetical protein